MAEKDEHPEAEELAVPEKAVILSGEEAIERETVVEKKPVIGKVTMTVIEDVLPEVVTEEAEKSTACEMKEIISASEKEAEAVPLPKRKPKVANKEGAPQLPN